MSITDELREWANELICHPTMLTRLNAIADRIDAEHQKVEDAGGAVEFADRLCRASERREDVTLWGVDYMPLPVDADGVPIHVGDVMEWVDIDGEVEVVCTVDAVGVDCFFAWDAANCRYAQKYANAYRHHHAPTVEDVLAEMVAKVIERGELTNGAAQTIAEYAAKLRLAGDE